MFIGVAQISCIPENISANCEKICSMTAQAASKGCDVVIFRPPAKQHIAHTSPCQQGLEPFAVKLFNYLYRCLLIAHLRLPAKC